MSDENQANLETSAETKVEVLPISFAKYPKYEIDSQRLVKPVPKPSNEMGYELAKFTLYVVAGFLVLLIISFVFFKRMDITTELFQATKISDSSKIDFEKLVNIAITERQQEREFILKISQIVLLNLLLPIITGTIGFIFGSKSASPKDDG